MRGEGGERTIQTDAQCFLEIDSILGEIFLGDDAAAALDLSDDLVGEFTCVECISTLISDDFERASQFRSSHRVAGRVKLVGRCILHE